MSKELVPSTPETVPTLINRKFYDLFGEPGEDELNSIRELLNVVQEERVATDEEVQGLKKLEKKVLEDQNNYKKDTEHSIIKAKNSVDLIFLLTLLVFVCGYISKLTRFRVVVYWPIDLIVVAIYLYSLYGSWLGSKLGICKNVESEVLENEDDNDWQDSMTSTELLSRQKALVNGWEQVQKERKELLKPNFWPFIARFLNMVYFGLRVYAIHRVEKEPSLFVSSFFTEPTSLDVQCILSIVLVIYFFIDFLVENDRMQNLILQILGFIILLFIFTLLDVVFEKIMSSKKSNMPEM
ncbi:hypothetical protein CAEBREN_22009 [Caenorhabditis brenneri]|uniref:Uncharacterized protein n=1 Tax=Caenorhabditis brenneri TaxID=135651 RepID=G0MBW0_CAEBE|nr:hypothetical protein CAEBREN_22009 [Caenorhabditis brenneri]